MNIAEATRSYESWLGKRIKLNQAELRRKHASMAADLFQFFRGTFYRWMQLWPTICVEEQGAPKVLAIGDVHVENFGTWRDVEGRLVWGINDFDEAFQLPYTLDLVRLAASAHLAIRGSQLKISRKDACGAILNGYREALESGGRPFVLAEDHAWLRSLVTGVLRDPKKFWAKLHRLPSVSARVPKSARRALERLLPEPRLDYRVVHRTSGLGSLGRERFAAIALYRGAQVAREAKALAPSACVWASDRHMPKRIRYQEILDRSQRAVDPFVRLKGRWIVRRLAPDCSRLDLSAIPKEHDEGKLLHGMGFEIGNVHLGTPGNAKAIRRRLHQRSPHWLHDAASRMVDATIEDWKDWRTEIRKTGPRHRH